MNTRNGVSGHQVFKIFREGVPSNTPTPQPQPPPPPPATSSQQLAHSTLDNLLVIKEYPDFTYPQGWTVLIYYYFSGMLVICRKTIFFFITHPQGQIIAHCKGNFSCWFNVQKPWKMILMYYVVSVGHISGRNQRIFRTLETVSLSQVNPRLWLRRITKYQSTEYILCLMNCFLLHNRLLWLT